MTSTSPTLAQPITETCVKAPPSDSIPRYPATWYRFGPSHLLRDKPISKPFLGRKLVAYRTESGRAVVMDGRCAHLAADLGRGTIRGDDILCPFHGWAYGSAGACTHIPGQDSIPPFAKQTVYPVVERHGSVFFFNDLEPLFPLPFFPGESPDDYVAGRAFDLIADCSWQMLTANGFDVAHFRTVHDRTLTSGPTVDCPSRYARRLRYAAEVTGHSLFDRILRPTVGHKVDVSITSWGGPLILVTGDFRHAKSRILIAAQPLEAHKTKAEVIVLGPRYRSPVTTFLFQFLSLEIRRIFTQGFMKDDLDRLPGIAYRPGSLLASEQELIDFFDWLSRLPRSTIQPMSERGDEGRDSQSY